ncbi:hypothetical protein ABW19_dt0210322 [Dactylella cylindrospora]|nr:hypothetical protein ABW19_dt0210322 [Dactylella cylindrospora]
MPSTRDPLGITGIILCGEGEKLKPIVSQTKLPKALLPVANRPMLQYPLEWLLNGGINTIIIVCIQGQETQIQKATKDIYSRRTAEKPNRFKEPPLPTIVPLSIAPSGTAFGTASVLRQPQVSSLIKDDFIVVSCDSICDISAYDIIREWISLPSSLHTKKGGMGVWYDIKKEKGVERDMIATAPIKRVAIKPPSTEFEISDLVISYASAAEDPKKDLGLRRSLFDVVSKVDLHTTYRDAQIYIFPYWSLKWIVDNPHKKMMSLKDDIVHWWAKATWQGSGYLAHKLGLLQVLDEVEGNDGQKSDSLSMVSAEPRSLTPADIENFLGMSTTMKSVWPSKEEALKSRKEINTRGWFPTSTVEDSPIESNSGSDKTNREFKKIKTPAYGAFFVPPFSVFKPKMTITPLATTPLVRRVDDLQLYLATCLELARNPAINPPGTPPLVKVHERANVSGLDTMVAGGTEVEEKALVKRSVVAANVKICKMTKIQGSVILEGAIIGANSKIEGCVIGRFVKIGTGCQITNCQIAEGVILKDKTIQKDTLITESIEESSDDDEDFFDTGRDGGGDDDEDDELDDSDNEEDSDDGDDNTTSKSIPTTSKESAAPPPASVPPASKVRFETKEATLPQFTDTLEVKETLAVAEVVKEPATGEEQSPRTEVAEEESPGEQVEEQVEPLEEQGADSGPKVPFLQLELEEEDEEDEEDDFAPDSDESSYCDEEYDSQWESEGAPDEEIAELSGPEDDGGPLKSPKRISRGFSEDMAKGIAQMAGLNLGGVAEGADKVEAAEKGVTMGDMPASIEVGEVKTKIDIQPATEELKAK